MSNEPPILSVLFPCEECHAPTDPEWWYRSDHLCGECLANYGIPLMSVNEAVKRRA